MNATESAGKSGEGAVDVGAALVADGEAAVAVHPGMGALHYPAVSSEAGAALDAPPGDTQGGAAGAALPAAAAVVVGLVGVQLVRSAPRTAPAPIPDRRDGVQGGRQHHAVVPVGPAERQAERRAAGIRDEVAFGARFAAVRRARPGLGSPLCISAELCPRPEVAAKG